MSPGNRFEAYQQELRNDVRNIKHLTRAICNLGLYPALHPQLTYTLYSSFQFPLGTFKGLFHDPYELAYLLWSLKCEFRSHPPIKSFLYIGTGTGYAFFAIHQFIRNFMNPNIVAKTIDTVNSPDAIDPELKPYVLPYLQRQTTDNIAALNEGYDIVFMDQVAHDFATLKRDFDNVKRKATVIILHQLANPEYPDTRKFFSQFRKILHQREVIMASPGKFGYGLVYTNKTVPV